MKQELTQVRKALLRLNKPDNHIIKGIIMDYLYNSRQLKKDLLLATDLGIIKNMLNTKYSGILLMANKKRQFAVKIPDEVKRNELLNICSFIAGKAKLNINGSYDSLPATVTNQSKEQLYPRIANYFFTVKSKVQNQVFKFKLNNWMKPVVTAIILLIILSSGYTITNRGNTNHVNTGKNISITTNSSSFSHKSIQGVYLGYITQSGNTGRFALFVKQYNSDTLLCSMTDYPYYRFPQKKFAALKINKNSYSSKFGNITVNNDTIKISSQITPDNERLWIFVKSTD